METQPCMHDHRQVVGVLLWLRLGHRGKSTLTRRWRSGEEPIWRGREAGPLRFHVIVSWRLFPFTMITHLNSVIMNWVTHRHKLFRVRATGMNLSVQRLHSSGGGIKLSLSSSHLFLWSTDFLILTSHSHLEIPRNSTPSLPVSPSLTYVKFFW